MGWLIQDETMRIQTWVDWVDDKPVGLTDIRETLLTARLSRRDLCNSNRYQRMASCGHCCLTKDPACSMSSSSTCFYPENQTPRMLKPICYFAIQYLTSL
jgi:hypothetical protein